MRGVMPPPAFEAAAARIPSAAMAALSAPPSAGQGCCDCRLRRRGLQHAATMILSTQFLRAPGRDDELLSRDFRQHDAGRGIADIGRHFQRVRRDAFCYAAT